MTNSNSNAAPKITQDVFGNWWRTDAGFAPCFFRTEREALAGKADKIEGPRHESFDAYCARIGVTI